MTKQQEQLREEIGQIIYEDDGKDPAKITLDKIVAVITKREEEVVRETAKGILKEMDKLNLDENKRLDVAEVYSCVYKILIRHERTTE